MVIVWCIVGTPVGYVYIPRTQWLRINGYSLYKGRRIEKLKKKNKKRYAVTHSLLAAFGAHVVDADL